MIPADWMPALANHLWQSTIVAGVAALLAFTLRKNHARARYWLWLVASAKFLIPFSLLVAAGSYLAPPVAQRVGDPQFAQFVEQIGRPFPAAQISVATPLPSTTHREFLPALLIALWLCGSLAVGISWWRRWRRIRLALRAASPLALEAAVPVYSSPTLVEPGVFGVLRPVLLLPAGITDHLTPEHLGAIFTHELCHVRHRDNLAAALHMAVEAIFWFHPFVWWIGARLVEERERACDEEVLKLGNKPEVYAESILKTCQFYVESPLACVSGITGSDLKKRIVRIMTPRFAEKLGFGRKLLLAAAGLAAVAAPIVFGLLNVQPSRAQSQPAAQAPRRSFEVASVKPDKSGGMGVFFRILPGGRFEAHNVPLKFLLEAAYNVKDSQISGVPGWASSEHYNIDAKADDSAAEAMRKMSPDERKDALMLMLQSLLEDRFKLALHHESKEMQIYALVVAKNGPKFHETTLTPDQLNLKAPPPPPPPGPGGARPRGGEGIWMMGRGNLSFRGAGLDMFANMLSRQLGRIVVDKTCLNGKYDFALRWTPDEGERPVFPGPPGGPNGNAAAPPPPEATGPSIFTALQEQLGLKLESQKGPVDVVVIDHVERPSEN